jgi:hypothetical protein
VFGVASFKNFKAHKIIGRVKNVFLISGVTCLNHLTNMSHKRPNFRAVTRMTLNEKKSKASLPSIIVCMSVTPSFKINMKFGNRNVG